MSTEQELSTSRTHIVRALHSAITISKKSFVCNEYQIVIDSDGACMKLECMI